MNNTCVVSFVYPSIQKHLNKFFNSLENQTDRKFDLIIFLNNSKNFNHQNKNIKIKIIKLNSSVVLSRFQMIEKLKKLKYKFAIFQDADDEMENNRIRICKNKLKSIPILVNDVNIINKEKKINRYFSKRIKNNTIINAHDIENYNFMGMSNTALQTKCIKKTIIPRNLKIKFFDWYFWTIILTKYKAKFTNLTSTKYYVNKKSLTCLPTKYSDNIRKKFSLIQSVHKSSIKRLINKNLIKNITKKKNMNIKNNNNKKYNFWWEI